jgi:hypothetical protein
MQLHVCPVLYTQPICVIDAGVKCDCTTLSSSATHSFPWLQALAAAPAPAPPVVKASAVELSSAATKTEMKESLAHHHHQ